jgi:small-conductance mechanosensitive channel
MPVTEFISFLAQALWAEFAAQAGWITPVVFLASGLLLGLIAEKIVVPSLIKLVQRTPWEADDVIVGALHNMPLLWCFLAGAWGAVNASVALIPRWEGVLRQSLLVAFLLSLTVITARIASGLVALYSLKSEGLIPSTTIFRNLTAVFIYAIGLLVILDSLGISITPILTALGVGGLAVALALQDTLSNLFAGLQIIASRQVKVGDYIMLDSGQEGYVTDIRWRNTVIRALPNNMIIIPNSKLASTITTNYYEPEKEMSVLVQVGVSYASRLEHVEKVTIEVGREVMREVQGGVTTHEPFIRYHTFADSSINFSVILRGKEFTDQFLIKHEFIKRLHRRYDQEGINIPFPIRTVYLKSEEPEEESEPKDTTKQPAAGT